MCRSDFGRALALAAATRQPALAIPCAGWPPPTAPGRDALFALARRTAARTPNAACASPPLRCAPNPRLPAPAAWESLRARGAASADPQVRADTDQLAAVFGDAAVLDRLRQTLGGCRASRPSRGNPHSPCSDAPATRPLCRSSPVCSTTLRSAPPSSRCSLGPTSPSTAAALLQRLSTFSEADRAAALTTLSSQAALARPLLEAAPGRHRSIKTN